MIPWTDYETRLLPLYAANGRTMAFVAQEFGRTRGAVNFKASQLGISFQGKRRDREDIWTYDEIRRLRGYAEAGCTQVYAARELGRSLPAIAVRASRLGIKFHGRKNVQAAKANEAITRKWRFW